MGVFGRVLFVVEVVEHPDDAPALDFDGIGDAGAPRAGTHRLLDGASVLAQGVGLRELVEELAGLVAGRPASGHARILSGRGSRSVSPPPGARYRSWACRSRR